MRDRITVMKHVHNWIALVAVLAVALLGALAIDRSSSEREQSTRAAVVTICEQINTGRLQISIEFDRLDIVAETLQGSLRVAQGEDGQSTYDRIEYARLQALIYSIKKPKAVPMINCETIFDR